MSVTAFAASTSSRAKPNASAPATTRQAIVSPMIHPGDMSRSRSSLTPVARDADSVATSPPTTGFARRASV